MTSDPGTMLPEAVKQAFDAQKAATQTRRRDFGLDARRAALDTLATAIRKNERAIVGALSADFEKPETEVLLTEIFPVLHEIRHTRHNLARWMRDDRAAPSLASAGTRGRIRYEPRGTCLIVAPWNYPFSLALGPLVSCLAAGNSAIVKPSEMTPATSALIARLVADAFDPDLVTVAEGGVETARGLLGLPFDHIFFTGSPEVGKIVMAAASRSLASVTLELGGKSPTIVGPGADLGRAADWITFGKFVNAGQTCIAPDHLFVHSSVREDFLNALRDRIARTYGSDGQSPDLARIVNERHAERLSGLLTDARSKGAEIIGGGRVEGRFIEPTLLSSLTPEMEIEQTEIFGPILPIHVYDDIETVLATIDARPKPLALYIFDRDAGRIERIVTSTSSGSVGINLTMAQFTHSGLPFGGVNHSGIGAAHGLHGFRAFSHSRAILSNRWSPLPLVFAPYGGRTRKLVRALLRWLG